MPSGMSGITTYSSGLESFLDISNSQRLLDIFELDQIGFEKVFESLGKRRRGCQRRPE